MATSLISNPPYNLKWNIPPFAQMQPRFAQYEMPPAGNANFAFLLTGLELIDEKAAFIFPQNVLQSSLSSEKEIRKQLVENNLIEAVIEMPDKMFVSTDIGVCILLINKKKQTRRIEMIDLRQSYVEEKREQNGQFGGSSHENRTYYKTFKVISEDIMQKAINCVENKSNIPEFAKSTDIESIKSENYSLVPSRYIEFVEREVRHRSYEDICADINRIVAEKNEIKLIVNESLSKTLGLYDMHVLQKSQPDLSDTFAIVGQKAFKEDFLTISKNAAEFKIENKRKDKLPQIIVAFYQMWVSNIKRLNDEENRYLAELRDALLPDLMSGNIEV